MCDQTEVSYLEDDVVWVKIGPIWWPGVVKDLEKDEEGREILSGFKKKPIAVVKFFQEDNYEFVKNLDHIYHYNCRKKDEFIKKGLDKFRTGVSHMKKFPDDVTTAESLTNGDIDIINSPKFYPEKKESYSEIFGSGKKKKKKDSERTPNPRARTPANVTPYRPITHQRFINKVLHGESDHSVKTLIQSSASPDDSSSKNSYKCHICKFETSRVNVIVAHHRLSHSQKNSINWTGSDSKLVRRKPTYKARKIKSKKLFDTSKEEITTDEDVPEKKKVKSKSPKDKPKTPEKSKAGSSSTSPLKRKNKEETSEGSETKKPRFTDVLLADWNEEEEDEKKGEAQEEDTTKKMEEDDTKNVSIDNESKTENTGTPVENSAEPEVSKKNKSEKMSCFDFDEEEEGFIGMSNANTYGRKIPRVIPVKDKTELGMDMEIEELFKRKNEAESQVTQEDDDKEAKEDNESVTKPEASESNDEKKEESEEKDKTVTPAKTVRRRKSKTGKEEEVKVNTEDSLALRRTRRPGAKKSYLNEIIEKIEDGETKQELNEKKDEEMVKEINSDLVKSETKVVKEEASSSSRRKQDFKIQAIDSDREEMIYSGIVNSEKCKTPTEYSEKKKRVQNKDARREAGDDLTAQIDSLLEETKLPTLPEISESTTEKTDNILKTEETKSNNFSFDYLPSEQAGKKTIKSRTEVKSISRMFSDSLTHIEPDSEQGKEPQKGLQASDSVVEETGDGGQSKSIQIAGLKFSQNPQKRGSVVLSSNTSETGGQVKVVPVVRQANTSKDCIVLPGKKFDFKKSSGEVTEQSPSESESSPGPKNIKTIKVKSDSLPSSLITAGKLKGQTIIHQKGGKYVIVTQPPHLVRQRTATGKPGNKVVILTNQHGEQKIITTSGLSQSKFKTSDSDKEAVSSASTSGSTAQPVIKMVPDGKGGIMKQLTVSPKKVILGGTKVLVSASGSTFSTGSAVQKIALSGSGTAKTAGGDFRLIENYKGSGKTVLIQGGTSPASGVVLKPTSGVPRQVTKVIQSPQTISALKKKPKILMRASTGQGEYLMQSASGAIESPTYIVKQKGADGKFSAQKLVRTEIVNQPKVSSSGTKTFFLSGQGSTKKGESFIIKTNESVPGKVIRMRQKLKEVDVSAAKSPQKLLQKTPEVYAIAQNSLLLPNQTAAESETPQIVQIQEQTQQPVLQTQVIAMPGPVGADGNQTFVLVSVDEHGVVQGVDNSVVAFDATAQQDQLFVNSTSTNNVILINPQPNEEVAPVFSTSSQDILAEALANTNVLEGNLTNEMDSVVPSILLPPAIPSSVVQETSITLQKPIMTPLEMPSSVTPDTSGLEPPPLPPTPTEEDVLMEESETPSGAAQENLIENNSKGGEPGTNDAIQTYLQTENFDDVENDATESSFQFADFPKEDDNQKMFDEQYEAAPPKSDANGELERKENEFYQTEEADENKSSEPIESKEPPQEDFIIENSQEEQSTNSFQSMPLLNDEPDTSDDAQGSEPIADQQFDAQKSRIEAEQFSQLIREQEPPSSTNNDMINENSHGEEFEGTKYAKYGQYEGENGESETKNKETEGKIEEEVNENGEAKEKESVVVLTNKESQSMPVIADESNVNTYEVDPIYTDVMSQKRIQEETEVSSTTDEYSSKDVGN